MANYAVVDIGTNSARLMIAEVTDGAVRSIFKTLRMIRVGEGMVEQRRITDAAMARAKTALLEFLDTSRQYGAQQFYCFATSAVREAENKQTFVDYVKSECGIETDIISGDMEAVLGFAGSVSGQGGMFDIGGGSTEVMTGSLDDVRYRQSFKIGTVKCLQMFPGADEAEPEAFARAHALARGTFGVLPDTGDTVFTGIGGTATALAAIDLGLAEYIPALIQGHEISMERAGEICDMLKTRTKAQRESLAGLEENRADVIVFGAIICFEFMRAVGAEKIIVSDSDNQEGYLAQKLGLLFLV
ncbi:MAG: hypothetical protein PHO15_00500 [Eubacteriales bacterium]|nr:hypothetical protein [Eubacteriales bacterium]